jgi:hyaluronan synthase
MNARWQAIVRAAILCGLWAIVLLFFRENLLEHLRNPAKAPGRPGLVWAALGTLLLCFRTALWFRYRPAPPATAAEAPALTVIIPAYNEGPMVAQSIDSVAAADYPRDRLEIIAVDDGSTDDTWHHVAASAARHPGLVTALRFPGNRGKRAALEAGFRRARGEIVVTIDSDSVIDRGSLLALAGAFRNPRVGAVAGKVAVYNRRSGLLPRMLHVHFTLSFDLLRAVQSVYGTVYCCPGALAAYRRAAIREVLDDWKAQTFLGVPCTYGEDRALTNYILDRGYDTVYQRSAVVHTIVPTTYSKLAKMYLRWDRSYVREELRFVRIVWKRPPLARLAALFETVLTNLRYPVGYISSVLWLLLAWKDPANFMRMMVLSGIATTFSLLFYLHSERSTDVFYGVLYAYFSAFALFWIFPYAAFTVRSRSWMTR